MADKEFTQICKEILGLSKRLEGIEPAELRKIKSDIEKINEAIAADKASFETKKKDFDGKYSGITELLNKAKSIVDEKIVLKTDFEVSKQENGYAKLPNGLIIQWGKTGKYPPAFTKIKEIQLFPIAFPNKCLSITSHINDHAINDRGASDEVQNRNIYVKTNYITNAGFMFTMHTPGGTEAFGWEFYWMAIGY